MTVSDLRRLLREAEEPERIRLLGRVLREARDPDVWRFTTIDEVVRLWPQLEKHLGRRRGFWQYLLDTWRELGLLEHQPT